MHKDVILNRLCYDRMKIREQTKHYQRLLETKPTLDMKPPRPGKKLQEQPSQTQCLTKKERMHIDKNVEIQKDNRLMLKKLLDIDLRQGDLSKKKSKPMVFKIRSLSTHGRSNHPQANLMFKSRIDELKKITDDNKVILNKLSTVKSCYDHKKWEQNGEHMHSVASQMSQVAGRYTKHPFFTQENPAANFYRNAVHSSNQKKRTILKNYQNFCHTFYQNSANRSISNIMNTEEGELLPKKKKRRSRKSNILSMFKLKESQVSTGDEYRNTMSAPFFKKRDRTFDLHNRSHRLIDNPTNDTLNDRTDNPTSAYDLQSTYNLTQQTQQLKFNGSATMVTNNYMTL